MQYTRRFHRGFTLLELMLVMGMLGVLASIVIIAVSPGKQLIVANDAWRKSAKREIFNAITQYVIYNSALPVGIPVGSSNALSICNEGQSANTRCVNLDVLVTDNYLSALPVDPAESSGALIGFTTYQTQGGFVTVDATHMGKSAAGESVAVGGEDPELVCDDTVDNDGDSDVDCADSDCIAGCLSSGLVGYWTFDDTILGTVLDSSGNGRHGTHNNNPTISQTVAPTPYTNVRSLRFFGNGPEYATLPHNNAYNFSTNATFCISVWVKDAGGNTHETILEKYSGGGGAFPFALRYLSGKLRFQRYDGEDVSTLDSTALINDGNWHHAVTCTNGSLMTMYLDGVSQGSVADNLYLTSSNTNDISVAHLSTSLQYNGFIDDVRIYNRMLTADEIAYLRGN